MIPVQVSGFLGPPPMSHHLNSPMAAGSSDTQSEVSSTADTETRDLVTALGLTSQDELHQERFRVDRRRLEQMISGEGELAETAGTFFQNIMDDTNTYISWPLRLKIGAKSKKDPHIRVAGRIHDVQVARQKILDALDARGARVTMKLDVSYTEHSHIIGKGGLTIKKVMNETGCHIHFPDSNRSNPNEKSNQVSIAGDMTGVELARASVRKITPLIFSFELPVLGASQPVPDVSSPYVQQIQEGYNVQVMFRTRPKLHATLVVIKGHEWEVAKVKKATLLLIKYMCDIVANQIKVQMTIEISPQHHSVVLGNGSQQLKGIMRRTQTQIMFPDAQDPNIMAIKRSCVTIIGNIDGVYSARQQLIGSLPLVLMFDLPDNVGTVEPENLTQLMNSLDVFINVRHKPKQNTLSVIVKGIERCASNIYEARNLLLKINEPRVIADLPLTYQVPTNEVLLPTLSQPPLSPAISPLPWNPLGGPFNYSISTISPLAKVAILKPPSPVLQTQIHNNLPRAIQGMGMMNSSEAMSHDSSGYQSFSSSSNSLEFPSSASAPISPRNSPNSQANQSSQYKAMSASSLSDLTNSMYDLSASDRRAPGCEKKTMDAMALSNMTPKGFSKTMPSNSNSSESGLTAEYAKMKMLAMQAMNIAPAGELRVPTSNWAGFGFSQTSPALQNVFHDEDEVWAPPCSQASPPTSVMRSMNSVSSNSPQTSKLSISDAMNQHAKQNVQLYKKINLSSLLASNGLDKYITLFASHEIDLATFCTLSENDFKHIGIEAWGARRRMLMAAAEYNRGSRAPLRSTGEYQQATSGTSNIAPGAERRHFSSTDIW